MRSDVPMKYPPDVFLFVCLSVCPEFLSRTTSRSFLTFVCGVSVLSNLKIARVRFFGKKSYVGFWTKSVQNGPKVRFFKFHENSALGIIPVF